MNKSTAVLFLTLVCNAYGDLPMGSLSWRSFDVVDCPGSDHVLLSTRDASLAGFHSVVFNSRGNSWSWSLLSMDRYGKVTGKTILLSDTGELAHWFTPCFTEGGNLVAVFGSRLGPGPAFFTTLNCADTQERTEVELGGPFKSYDEVLLTSLEELDSGGFLVSGAGYGETSGMAFFTGEITEDGTAVWLRELPRYSSLQLEDTSMEVLRDGSFMISFEEDAFPSGISIARLDPDGQEAWEAFIDLQCEFTAVVNDFLQLNNGSILGAGTYDQLGTLQLRGVLALFDPSLEEIWERSVHYGDFTEITSLQYTQDNEILCTGWYGLSAQGAFTAEGMNILLAFLDPRDGSLSAFEVFEQGNQIPCAVFEGGFGEYFVIGGHTPVNETESDVFFGRVLLER